MVENVYNLGWEISKCTGENPYIWWKKSTADRSQLIQNLSVMLAGASMAAQAGSRVGKCMGANSCKGQSSCKTATSSCKGLNSCAGKGFLEMSKADCDSAGGMFES